MKLNSKKCLLITFSFACLTFMSHSMIAGEMLRPAKSLHQVFGEIRQHLSALREIYQSHEIDLTDYAEHGNDIQGLIRAFLEREAHNLTDLQLKAANAAILGEVNRLLRNFNAARQNFLAAEERESHEEIFDQQRIFLGSINSSQREIERLSGFIL